MNDAATDIIDTLLNVDENPPSEDYSPYEFGQSVVQGLDEKAVSNLIRDSIHRLPGSLAESFIDGILDARQSATLQETLLDALPRAKETGSAGTVVRLLRCRCNIDRIDLVRRFIADLGRAKDQHAQDIYAYALLRLLGDRQPAGSKASVDMKRADGEYAIIQSALADLSTMKLSKYARETLERCVVAK